MAFGTALSTRPLREPWFVVLPDHPAIVPAVRVLRSQAQHVYRHRSGRPWLMGCWPDEWTNIEATGDAQTAILGPKRIGVDGHRNRCHLAVNEEGRLRIQGTLSGQARVFHATFNTVTLAANRADVLALVTRASFDEEALATRLLELPLDLLPLWRGVHAVRPDHCLFIDRQGRASEIRYWVPPEPELPLSAGAREVYAALRRSVRSHLVPERISADLSGGLDSTALCFLADHEMTALTAVSEDPANEDAHWAERAARHLPHAVHKTVTREELGLHYDLVDRSGYGLDFPFVALHSFGIWARRSELLAAMGSRIHMSGIGGDQLFQLGWSYLPDLMRRRPLAAMSHLRGRRARWRWPLRTVARMMFARTPYSTWLANAATVAGVPEPGLWGLPARIPPWATAEAVDAIQRILRRTAEQAGSVSPHPAQHQTVLQLWQAGIICRQSNQIPSSSRVWQVYPYCDGDVLDAVLRVRLEDRGDPWRYKPLLVESMRGHMPDHLLARTTKGHVDQEIHEGFRRNRADLLALCDDSILAELGLIDEQQLRRVLLGPQAPDTPVDEFGHTLACEAWLRTQTEGSQWLYT
ncbi:asparagine synthase-related protein [Thermoactinospora rubra]|uniref:asparagine synthase-related protein n=1 Tax=Thermoactinospora rubra TaxID=1088767 RepID=UPI000A10EF85|nr:asparagine synthase-related protein [Thermoactinospora rubra]